MYHHQILIVKDQGSTMMQDQSQAEYMANLY
jgi:hypothetical protein